MKNSVLVFLCCILSCSNLFGRKGNQTHAGLISPAYAAYQGNLENLKACMEAGMSPDKISSPGEAAIQIVARMRNLPMVEYLLQVKANANLASTDSLHRTALHEILTPKFRPYDNSTIIFSAKEKTIIRLLLKNGADVSIQDADGVTPLMLAAEAGDTAVLNMLVNEKTPVWHRDKNGADVFDYAHGRGQEQAIRILLHGKPDARLKTVLLIKSFARWSGLLALLIIVFAFIQSRRARLGKIDRNRNYRIDLNSAGQLEPLRCPSCGTGVALKAVKQNCVSCGAEIVAPQSYSSLLEIRKTAAVSLKQAEKQWKQTIRLSSFPVRALLVLFTSSWFIAVMYAQFGPAKRIFYGNTSPWDLQAEHRTVDLATFWSLLSALLIIAAGWIYARYLSRIRKNIPPMPEAAPKNIGNSEIGSCESCGGAVEFDPQALTACCVYCGTESFRTAMVHAEHSLASQTARNASISIRASMIQLNQLRVKAWASLQRPLWALMALLAVSMMWAMWDFTQKEIFLSIGWIMTLPAMLFLTWAFAKSFPMRYTAMALLLIGVLLYYAWASLVAGLNGAFISIAMQILLLPLLLIFLAMFQRSK